MNPEDRIRMLMELLSQGGVGDPTQQAMAQRPREMFAEGIPSVEDINTAFYETDPEFPGGAAGYTMTPPAAAPKRGSAASIAAAHQRRKRAGY